MPIIPVIRTSKGAQSEVITLIFLATQQLHV